ncbi:putative transposase-associated domain-containing protein [Tanacetum coccineum]|uniref:Transposase-associated domain-containing protein n=1 Tax=Tanacetum coccineum TaxID=301880 RepID=A0ABQ4Z5G3_9ASTR
MDESWIKADIGSKTFKDGVQYFIDFATARSIRGIIACPCLKCYLCKRLEVDAAHVDILQYGFLPGYKTWTIHGESSIPSQTSHPNPSIVHETSVGEDDIRGLVQDALGASSLPLNNTHKSDSRVEGNINESNEEPAQSSKDKDIPYERFLEERDKELYPGCKLKRMYMREKTAKEMRWHEEGRTKDGKLRHSADSLAWKAFDARYTNLASDPRSVRLSLASDGFNPFRTMSTSYSTWPVLFTPYNLPPWLCMKKQSVLSSIILGEKGPGNDIDVYLQPLIKKLKLLWAGVDAYDAFSKQHFKLRASLLWTVNDFPAYANLFGWSQWLEENHNYRLQKDRFDGTLEKEGPPTQLTGSDILKQAINRRVALRIQIMSLRRFDGEHQLWKKKSVFFELPYWEYNLLRHNLDVMHIEKNIFDNVIGTLLNLDEKTKDNENSRKDLMILKNLKVSDGYASNISRVVSLKDRKIMNLKSHDGHILMQDILPIALRACMFSRSQTRVVKAMCDLCLFFKGLCDKVLDMRELDQMEHDIVQTLCELEQLFPPSFFTIMVHLTIHLISEAKLGGPVHYRWMYPVERYLMQLKSYVQNKAQPEGSIAEAYIKDECLTFCSRYFEGVETPFNRPPRTDESIVKKEMYMLNSSGRKLVKLEIIELDWNSFNQAHRYVLLNHKKIQPFRDHFLGEQQALKGRPLDSKLIEKLFVEEFPQWLHNQVSFLEKNKFDKEVLSLAIGPKVIAKQFNGFITNGYRFLIKKREKLKKTQNSSVIVAVEGGYYYGKLIIIIELDYFCGYKVVLFQCDWVDIRPSRGLKKDKYGFPLVNFSRPLVHTNEKLSDDPFIISSQAKQVFYIDDIRDVGWSYAIQTKPRDIYDIGSDKNKDEFESYTQCMPCTIPILDDVNEAPSWHRTNIEIDTDYLRFSIGRFISCTAKDSKHAGALFNPSMLSKCACSVHVVNEEPTSASSSSLLDNQQDEVNVVNEYEKKLLYEVEVIDEHGKILRIQKMTCKQVYKLREGEKILVHVYKKNQLIKTAGNLCRRFITLLLKEPKLCPPDFKDWTECKTGCGVRLLLELRLRFSLPERESVDDVIFKIMDKMSLNGKRARGGQVHIHTTGAHSFAWKRDEQKVLYNEEPNDVVFFRLAHTTLKGSFVTEASGKFMLSFTISCKQNGYLNYRDLVSQTSEVIWSFCSVEAEIARDIIQKLRPGRVTGHGAGVKKSQVTKFGIEYRRMRGEEISNEKRFLLEKINFQSKKIEAQSKQIELMSKKNEAQSKKLESQSKQIESLSKNNESQSKQIESLSKNNETQSKQIECLIKKNETQSIQLSGMEEKMNFFMGELQVFKTAFPTIYSKSNTLSCASHGDQ